MPDGTHIQPASQALRGYRCEACKAVTHLSDLNDDMLCEACGEPEIDAEDRAPSETYLRRWEGTFSI